MPSPGLCLNPVSTENIARMMLTASERPVTLWRLQVESETTLCVIFWTFWFQISQRFEKSLPGVQSGISKHRGRTRQRVYVSIPGYHFDYCVLIIWLYAICVTFQSIRINEVVLYLTRRTKVTFRSSTVCYQPISRPNEIFPALGFH
jgi:hypothetical protein